jgi:hypothetical protein
MFKELKDKLNDDDAYKNPLLGTFPLFIWARGYDCTDLTIKISYNTANLDYQS